ncbi:uncharacterized protein PG986_014488 [Apiospora aurea]|uniref:NB-ARC domain-containing protein n=1 Tax=Apiospora aurea TaxID=335848 RepID=A0ABR1PT54_9PEZI
MPWKFRCPKLISSKRSDNVTAPSEVSTPPQFSAPRPQSSATTSTVPYGLEIVFEGDDPVVEYVAFVRPQCASTLAPNDPTPLPSIVAVYGLNGHREKTWTARNGVHWLHDLLPTDTPHARIMSWGYDANTHSSSGTMRRPIVFIAHSLGGIIVKSALIHSAAAWKNALEKHRSIRLSTAGIMFMGTPHQGGSSVQLGRLLINIASLFVAADDRILRHLERDSEWLQQQLGQYAPISGDFVTKFAYEVYETPTVLGHSIMVVPHASAVVPGQADAEHIAIHSNHHNMVKFGAKTDEGYKAVSRHLRIMMMTAVERVQSQWQEEERVVQAQDDSLHNAFSLPLDLSAVSTVEQFVARTEELKSFHEILEKPDGRRRTAVVHGLGGIGKTQLAVEYLRRYQSDYSATVWLNARDEISLQQSFAQVAERILRRHPRLTYIKLAVDSRKPEEITGAVKRLDNLHHRGATTDETAGQDHGTDEIETDIPRKEYDIRSYFPGTDQGAILITTRSTIHFGSTVQLGKLKKIDDSLQILAFTSHRDNIEQDEDAVKVARRLDGLPLALSTTGAYLRGMPMTWKEYLELYEDSWSELQKESPNLSTYDSTMYATWNISFARIQKQDQAAATLLEMWAYFDKDDLWFELLRKKDPDIPIWLQTITGNRIVFDKSIRVLCSHGLVDADPATRECGAQSRGYNVHGCVHSWMQHVLNPRINLDMAKAAIQCVARHVPCETELEFWWVHRRLIQHADHGLRVIGKDGLQDKAWVFGSLGNIYASQGRLGEAETMYQRALQGKEKALGADHTSTLDTVNNLGSLYASQNRLSEAEAMYQRALQGYEKALGDDMVKTYPPVLNALENFGDLLRKQGKGEAAKGYYLRAEHGVQIVYGVGSRKHEELVAKLQSAGIS